MQAKGHRQSLRPQVHRKSRGAARPNECLGQFLNSKTADGATVYNTAVAYPIGIIAAALFLGIFLYSIKKRDVKPQYETLGK